jgi:hypothetical protein
MSIENIVIAALAAYYVAFAVSKTHGLFGVFATLRAYDTSGLTKCIYCLLLWAALACYLLVTTPAYPAIVVLAIAGAGVLLHRYTGGNYLE